MPIKRLNHAVLYVRDAQRAAAFYRDALGFRVVAEMGNGNAVFLQAEGSTNDHDLGLFSVGEARPSAAGRGEVGLYHLAWEVDTLAELQRVAGVLREHDALVGASDHSTTKALYGRDPDGIEFEVSWLVPADQLDDDVNEAKATIQPLDLDKEIARYGADTRGGVGVSTVS